MTVKLTKNEVFLLKNALRIAIEDGSLYGGDRSDTRIEKQVEALLAKLGGS
jgi:hypothetical protein